MKRKGLWLNLALANLCIVALLGFTLRTKYLFPLPYIDYKNLLSAHSHFAFGGWVTLSLMMILVDSLLEPAQRQRKIYQWLLGGIWLTSMGMLFSFPFQGYGSVSLPSSTLYIFLTYGFAWVFLKDLKKTKNSAPVKWLTITALMSLVVSSVGPFTLAYIMATKTGNPFIFRDAVYTFLHFQYNGFFTLAVFALLFAYGANMVDLKMIKKIRAFAFFLCLSVLPSLFLSLLWHSYNVYIRTLAILGCLLIIVTIIFFTRLTWKRKIMFFRNPVARTLLAFALISFTIKMILQTGTIVPSLGNAVFGFRPIIIGFLHLVFLGLVTFFILGHLVETGSFPLNRKISRVAIICFSAAIILNELILFFDGVGLLLHTTTTAFGFLLWIASILLVTGAILLLVARLIEKEIKEPPELSGGSFPVL
jgi:hypothetical protein